MRDNQWIRLLAYVTGLVNQELQLQNEYLAAENRILKSHCKQALRLNDGERATLAEIGRRLGRKVLQQVACVARPDTILAWYRRRLARASSPAIHGTLPCGTEPSREEQPLAVPRRGAQTDPVQPPIRCKERLGGLLKYYHRGAA